MANSEESILSNVDVQFSNEAPEEDGDSEDDLQVPGSPVVTMGIHKNSWMVMAIHKNSLIWDTPQDSPARTPLYILWRFQLWSDIFYHVFWWIVIPVNFHIFCSGGTTKQNCQVVSWLNSNRAWTSVRVWVTNADAVPSNPKAYIRYVDETTLNQD